MSQTITGEGRGNKKLTNLFIVEAAGVLVFVLLTLAMYLLNTPVYTFHPAAHSWNWGPAPDSAALTFLGRCLTGLPIFLGLDFLFHGYDLFIKKIQVPQDHRLVKLAAGLSYPAAVLMFVLTLVWALQ